MSFDSSSSSTHWNSSIHRASQQSSRLKKDSSSTASGIRSLSPLDTTVTRSTPTTKSIVGRRQDRSANISSRSNLRTPDSSRPTDSPKSSLTPQLTSPRFIATSQGASQHRNNTSSSADSSQGTASPTNSSFQKISVAQLAILLDTNSDRDGPARWDSVKNDRALHLLNSGGQEVFAVFIRKAILLNLTAILAGDQRTRHGTYRLLQAKVEEVRQEPTRAFQIVDAIDAAKEEPLRNIDVVGFVSHFLQDCAAHLILSIAFTSSTRPNIRQEAEHFVAELVTTFAEPSQDLQTSFNSLSSSGLALLSTWFALESSLGRSKRRQIREKIWTRISSLKGNPIPELDMASQLWKLPERDRSIIDAFKRRGPRSASNSRDINEVVASIQPNASSPTDVAHAILYMLFGQPSQHYDLNEFVSAVKAAQRLRSLDWNSVVKAFDVPDLRLHTDEFMRLMQALRLVAIDNQDFDIQRLWGGQWTHPRTQTSFLRCFFEMNDVSPNQIPGFRSAFQAEEFEKAPHDVRERVNAELETHQCNFYAMKAVFDTILSSDTFPEEDDASSILHAMVSNHLFGFLLSLTHITTPTANWTPSQEKALDSCFRLYLEGQRSDSDLALKALFHQNRDLVESLCRVTFHADPRQTDTIAQKAQQLGWIDFLLQSYHTPLALDVACLLSKQQPDFDLEQWISRAIEPLPRPERALLGNTLWKFLRIKADDEYRSQKTDEAYQSIPLSLPAVFVLLWKVQDLLEDRDQVKAAQCTCLTTYPRLMNYGTESDAVLEQASRGGHKLNPETDVSMSELFGQMYRSEVSIRDMINEMRMYKTSQNPQLQDLFCCIVHGLFDEYGCYGEYPEDALEKTALLFGSIVKFRLLPPIPQEYGLTLIVDAVKGHVADSPMHRFGIEALLQVGDQLVEWPEVCTILAHLPTLQHPEIIQRAREGMVGAQLRGGVAERNGHEDYGLPNGSTDDLVLEAGARGFRSLHADPPAADADYHEPDQKSQEKILFVINNLSKENMESKLGDLREVLKPEHYQWFAAYLVEQRARLELNNQELYNSVLLRLSDSALSSEVLRETYVSLVKIMSARSTMESQVERTHLKNLGAWLGSLTLAQDKPIKHRNIYFMDLLLEGFETQRLTIVIPFTCKVLVQGKGSIVFKPPNPWLMEILGVLLELYQFADLKLNLKFEIEVLCKDLSLDHKKLEPANFIREHQEQQRVEQMTNASVIDGIDEYDLALRGGRLRETFSVAEIMQSLPDLETVLRYPPPSGSQQEQAHVRNVINKAVQRAIEEIIAPVVERSITIASLSTSQLVSKDYLVEGNADSFSNAAREMVKSLAGSLALVTCKEPLRMSIQNYIRQNLEEIGGTFMAEGQILMTVNDNLDVAASLIKDAAELRAVPEMDQVVSAELEERRRFMAENPNGGDFYGQSLNRWSTWIPAPYKMIPGGLNEAQRAVYEEFERRVHGMNAGHIQGASTDSTGRQLPDVLNEALAMPNLSTPAGQPALPHQSPMTQHESRANSAMPQQRMNGLPDSMPPADRISLMIDEVIKATRASPVGGLKHLNKGDPIFQDIRQILMMINTPSHPTIDHVARQTADKITSTLLRQAPQNSTEAEFLAFLLNKLCLVSEAIVREVMRWISAHEDVLLGNASTVAAFISVGLMESNRVDNVLASAIRERSDIGLRLLRDLMDQTLFNDEPTALRADFVNSIVALYAWLKDDGEHPLASELSDKLKSHGVPEFAVVALNDKAQAKEDQMRYVCKEWSSLFENSAFNEATHTGFLRDLHGSQLINSAEDMVTFLRLSIDNAVEQYEIEAQSFRGSIAAAFSKTDALALLIVLLVKYQGEENGAVKLSKSAYLDSILSLVVLIVHNHQELRGVNFNQRVFTRLFGSILHNYAELRFANSPEHVGFMLAFSKTMQALQPSLIPAFVFGWTTLVSHRVLVEGMLRQGDPECALHYRELAGLMLEYPAYLMEQPRLRQTAEFLMRGVYKNFFVLQNDFSDFLCENHAFFCARVSATEPIVRNVILSAQPFGLVEPNPLTPNLRVERIEDMKKAPNLSTDVARPLAVEGLSLVLTQALRKASEIDGFAKRVTEFLGNEEKNQPSPNKPARDSEMLQSLVVAIGQDALNNTSKFDSNSNHIQLLSKLLNTFEPRQKYILVTSIFDQLRYPNSHTEYFCKVVLNLWGTNNNVSEEQSYLREVIIRVLRERIDPLKPNPWGAVIVFKELSENSSYGFWDTQPFVNEPELRQRLVVAARGH
ncbi:CCR4-NOT core subunit cdc39 [Knufia fluminis]|uniref:General negative regulator of transcription subunit 1 n=1 Tax=Knufia fluminis TaxID=191047 RepID=A0AAN8EME9_9EURO|nr:CCR4-NOT core subunit cdc39 [Knufia fluminis]